MSTAVTGQAIPTARQIFSKVPEVTIFFWIIKVLCTTVGETAADALNFNMHLGLTGTTLVMGALLLIALFFQFRADKYQPVIYWLVVVLLSVVGTLITDNLSDNLKVPLLTSTIAFSIALALTFWAWYASEKTLSIHSIFTTRREAFYWTAILFTFALGTASGDLIAEKYGLGYLISFALVAGVIALVAFAQVVLKVNAVLTFWIAYILTRPLGASLGDYLSQAHKDGGLGLGTGGASAIFLTAILVLVVYLALTKRDAIAIDSESLKVA